MNGFIANTDLDWHRLLLARQRAGLLTDEVNFWKPSESATFKAVRPGEPLLFRLKSPVSAIGGFGLFERFSTLPSWLAWETFREGNGVPSQAALEQRILAIRARNGMEATRDPRIGCILLAGATFFEPHEYVALPADWPLNAVSGKTYDLAAGEGARVWAEVLERVQLRGVPLAANSAPAWEKYGEAVLVRPRLGQAGFRIAVLEAYDRACAVTTEHSLPVLEAAHIRPYADDAGVHDVTNGLLLRSDIHKLFDRGYVTVTPDFRFRVSDALREDYANGKTYFALQDRPIVLPSDPRLIPSREALAWHGEATFRRSA